MKKNKDLIACDIVIVGAGVSGLFTAWRLLAANPALNIIIIEKLGRTGGRLQTTTVGIEYPVDGQTYQVKDEEGGMRFNSGMPYISKLVNTLGLLPVPFYMSYNNTNRCYFRGQSFTIAETPQIWAQIYNLAPGEANQSPGTVIVAVLQAVLAQNPGYKFSGQDGIPATPLEWQTFRNECLYNNFTINQWGFWALMRAYGLTEECVEWLKNVVGFMGPTQSYINAGESLQILCDFPNNPSFNTLADGFESIPDSLALLMNNMATINLNETVVSVAEAGGMIQVASDLQTYSCQNVILAAPAKGLKEIIGNSVYLQQAPATFIAAVNSVKNMELTKIGLYFNERWWHQNSAINLTCGPSFNDLPLGSVYCFNQYPDNETQDQAYYGPAALTIYTDYDRGNFWKEMQNLGGAYQGSIAQPENTFPASASLVSEALRQIKLLFGLSETDVIPNPVLSTYRVWGQGEFGHGYHQYKLNIDDSAQVYPFIWNPLPNVFVCNESWSPEQGWVEGALIAADAVLTQGLNLPPFVTEDDKNLKIKSNASKNDKRPLGPANFA